MLKEHNSDEMWSPTVDPDSNANDMAKLSGFIEQYGSQLGPGLCVDSPLTCQNAPELDSSYTHL